MTTKTKVRCAQCEMPEAQCSCEKYCCGCENQTGVRLCDGGLYYCQDCREACDYKVAD